MARSLAWMLALVIGFPLAAQATPTSSQGNRWLLASVPPAFTYVDTTTIDHPSKSIYLVWYKVISSEASSPVKYEIQRMRFDCEAHTVAIGYVASYDAKDAQVLSLDLKYANPRAIVPESVNEGVMRGLCGST